MKTSHEWARENQQVYKAGTGIKVRLFGTSFFAECLAKCKRFPVGGVSISAQGFRL